MADALGIYGVAGGYPIWMYEKQVLECHVLVGDAFSSWTMLMGGGVPNGMAQGRLSSHGSSVQIPDCMRSALCTFCWWLLR